MGSIQVETNITPRNEYKLPRGGREAIRLTAQHHMLTSRQGYLLHPTIAKAIESNPSPRIADVATGTGIWALDLAQKMPHAEIIGLDISDGQFSPEWTWPSNVSLGLYDLLQDVPLELQGQFDVVHVRLLLAAGPAVDKHIFIDRFRTLLRPGGWLQWDELSFPHQIACYPSKLHPGTMEMRSMESHPIIHTMGKYLGFQRALGWVSDFEQVMASAGGFAESERNAVPVRPHLLQMESELTLAVKTELSEMLIRRKGAEHPEIVEELGQALARLYADAEDGVKFAYSWNVCIARKA